MRCITSPRANVTLLHVARGQPLLGLGSNGVVVRVYEEDEDAGETFAVKVSLSIDDTLNPAEYDIPSRLHQNLLPLLAITFEPMAGRIATDQLDIDLASPGLLKQVMPLAGPSFDALIETGRLTPTRYAPSRVLAWLADVYRGIDYLHDHGFTHCDIKASNVLLSLDEQSAMLIDFGWSGHVRPGEPQRNVTPFMRTPEEVNKLQKLALGFPRSADLWAVGFVTSEILGAYVGQPIDLALFLGHVYTWPQAFAALHPAPTFAALEMMMIDAFDAETFALLRAVEQRTLRCLSLDPAERSGGPRFPGGESFPGKGRALESQAERSWEFRDDLHARLDGRWDAQVSRLALAFERGGAIIADPRERRVGAGPESHRGVVVARRGFASDNASDLSFSEGDRLYVLDQPDGGWWFAQRQGDEKVGWIPRELVEAAPPTDQWDNLVELQGIMDSCGWLDVPLVDGE